MTALHPAILIIDDDPQVHRYLRSALIKAGYRSLNITSGAYGLQAIANHLPDAIIVDIELRDVCGVALLAQVRHAFRGPILVLSARIRDIDKINALDLGADDYVTKPFSVNELLARLRVAFRRRFLGDGIKPVVQAQGLSVDLIRRTVTRNGALVSLTDQQYTILARLAEAGGAALTHEALAATISSNHRSANMRKIPLLVQQLRNRIESAPKTPLIITTDRRIGYRLNVDQ